MPECSERRWTLSCASTGHLSQFFLGAGSCRQGCHQQQHSRALAHHDGELVQVGTRVVVVELCNDAGCQLFGALGKDAETGGGEALKNGCCVDNSVRFDDADGEGHGGSCSSLPPPTFSTPSCLAAPVLGLFHLTTLSFSIETSMCVCVTLKEQASRQSSAEQVEASVGQGGVCQICWVSVN